MLYIIQNDPEVPPGIMASELERRGVDCTVLHPYLGDALPAFSEIAAVIVLGGAMGANDDSEHPFLSELKDFIRGVVECGIPFLGICLGGQLLAAALGAEVASNTFPEQGTYSVMLTEEGSGDRLFDGISPAFITFQWHNDSFSIPKGCVRLAFSGSCRNQAFRAGEKAWGLQFHPEVDAAIVANWSSLTAETADRTDDIVAEFRRWESEYLEIVRKLTGNFVAVVNR
jgi:GMP synthase (glutamine-hydrolysing)